MKWYTALALILLGFAAGWMTNGWRVGEQKAKQEVVNTKADLKSASDALQHVNTKLVTVVQQVDKAAAQTSATLTTLDNINAKTNQQYSMVTAQTERISDEIGKLSAPKCVFSFDYGRMYRSIGENANAGRPALYGTKSSNPN